VLRNTDMRKSTQIPAWSIVALLAVGCAPGTPDPLDCQGGECDDGRTTGIGNLCEDREADAFKANRATHHPFGLRWSCADVNQIPSGLVDQEYCESFAVIRPPVDGEGTLGEPVVLGKTSDFEVDDSEKCTAQFLSGDQDADLVFDYQTCPYIGGRSGESGGLASEELDALGALPDETEVGACVFTSWHSDFQNEFPIWDQAPGCGGPDGRDPEADCPQVQGLDLTKDNFRMTQSVNSLSAAGNLVDDCLGRNWSVANFDGSPVEDDFMRGCLLNELINRTSYRKSDTTVCSAAMRLTECNCWPNLTGEAGDGGVDTNVPDFPEVLAGVGLRGFRMGTWEHYDKVEQLGCRYVETNEDDPSTENRETSFTVVECPITAAKLRDIHNQDLRRYCKDTYADELVVQITFLEDYVQCDPTESESPFAGTCPLGEYGESCVDGNCAWYPGTSEINTGAP